MDGISGKSGRSGSAGSSVEEDLPESVGAFVEVEGAVEDKASFFKPSDLEACALVLDDLEEVDAPEELDESEGDTSAGRSGRRGGTSIGGASSAFNKVAVKKHAKNI